MSSPEVHSLVHLEPDSSRGLLQNTRYEGNASGRISTDSYQINASDRASIDNCPTDAGGRASIDSYQIDPGALSNTGRPKSLRESSPSCFWRLFLPGCLILIPIAFITLVICIGILDGKTQSPFGDGVLQVLQVASTLWPIGFAAVLGSMMRTLALLHAEKGAELGHLEFLLTSTTISAAVHNCLSLGYVHVSVLAVAALWALSPLGGQAAVRSLALHSNSTSANYTTMQYFNNNLSTSESFFVDGSASAYNEQILDLRTAVSSSFSTPDVLVTYASNTTSGSRFDDAVGSLGGIKQAVGLAQKDLWRNVRVPFVHLLDGYDPKEPFAWLDVANDSIMPVDSFIGTPVLGLPSALVGNASFLLQTSQQKLSCKPWFDVDHWAQANSTRLHVHNITGFQTANWDRVYGAPKSSITTYPEVFVDLVEDAALQEHLHNFGGPPDAEMSSKLSLIFGSTCTSDLTICEMSTSYVDTVVDCVRAIAGGDLACKAVRSRHTPGFPVDGNTTAISFLYGPRILAEVPTTLASSHPSEYGVLETYLRDPPATLNRQKSGYGLDTRCYSVVPLSSFESRLAMALNTFIRSSYNVSSIYGGAGTRLEDRGIAWSSSTASWTEFTAEVYRIDRGWFAVYVLSTLALTTCALTNIVLRRLARAPDFLGSIVALTRDSPFVHVSAAGSGLSARDQLKALKHKRVQVRDVWSFQQVGRIAFSDAAGGPGLDLDRLYE